MILLFVLRHSVGFYANCNCLKIVLRYLEIVVMEASKRGGNVETQWKWIVEGVIYVLFAEIGGLCEVLSDFVVITQTQNAHVTCNCRNGLQQ